MCIFNRYKSTKILQITAIDDLPVLMTLVPVVQEGHFVGLEVHGVIAGRDEGLLGVHWGSFPAGVPSSDM